MGKYLEDRYLDSVLEDYFNDHDSRLMHTRVTIVAEVIIVGSNDTAEYNNDWT